MSQDNRNEGRSDCRQWRVDALRGRFAPSITAYVCLPGLSAPAAVQAEFGSPFCRQLTGAVIPSVSLTIRPHFATYDSAAAISARRLESWRACPYVTVVPGALPVIDSDLRKSYSAIAGKNLTTADPTTESVVPAVADEVPGLTACAHAGHAQGTTAMAAQVHDLSGKPGDGSPEFRDASVCLGNRESSPVAHTAAGLGSHVPVKVFVSGS